MKSHAIRNIVTLMLLVLTIGRCWAEEAPEPERPKSELVQKLKAIFYDPSFAKIPDRTFPAADFGVKADGETVNTKAIQAAIDAAHAAGGGIVTLPQGTTMSGALFVKSNVELRLDEGVILKAVNDNAKYPEKWTRIAGIEMDWPAALINVYEEENVRITGKGIIDGNGQYWWDKFHAARPSYEERGLRWALDYDVKRVRPVVVYESKNVLLKDFQVQRAGFWTITSCLADKSRAARAGDSGILQHSHNRCRSYTGTVCNSRGSLAREAPSQCAAVFRVARHHFVGDRKAFRRYDQRNDHLHTVGPPVPTVAELAQPFCLRYVTLKIGAGQVVEQDIVGGIEQIVPLLLQEAEQVGLMFAELAQTAVERIFGRNRVILTQQSRAKLKCKSLAG